MFVSILHVDADCFFASVEQRDEPRLRGKPLVVATWVVMAASYEARAFGVRSAMHASEARRLCPGLLAVEPRTEAYAEASRELFEVFDALSPRVERHGSEEAFLEGPPELAGELRRRVRDDVGLPVTVGVASTKIAAKMASRAAKPDGLLVLAPSDERGFLDAHAIEQLWGIGRATATKLHARGIATVGEAVALSEVELVALLGRGNGRRVHALVNNRDRTPVERGGPPRSFGSTRSLGRDDDPPLALEAAAERVAMRLQSSGTAGRTITLHLRFDDHTLAARSRTLPAATADATTIHHTAATLLDTPRRLTRIGVSVGNLEAADSLRLWTPSSPSCSRPAG
jgi:DNA polymerase-4